MPYVSRPQSLPIRPVATRARLRGALLNEPEAWPLNLNLTIHLHQTLSFIFERSLCQRARAGKAGSERFQREGGTSPSCQSAWHKN